MAPSTENVARWPNTDRRNAVNSACDISPDAMANLAVLDRAKAADVAGNRHIVGRIGEHHLRSGVAEQLLIGLKLSGIAADQAMIADPPDVARTAYRRASCNLNNGVCSIIIVRGERKLANQQVDFRQIKARQRNVEIDFELGQVLQLDSE